LSLNPDLAGAWLGRGYVYGELKQYADAFAAFDRALSLKPDLAEAWAGRGNVYSELKQYGDAFAAYDRALNLDADLKYASGLRLHAKMQLCDWTNIEAEFGQILSMIRDRRPLSPFICLSVPSSLADQLNCAKVFVANQPRFQALWRGETYSHERIRVAYLSADFNDHPVALLTVGLFEFHDMSRFEVTAVSYGPERDSTLRQRIKGSVERFIDAGSRQEEEIAEIIRRHEIDIAVDLMAFTENNRFGVLARRPAPIQVNYLGYPGTMGADCIDYILADSTIVPEGQHQFYAERVVWLPGSYQVNDPRRAVANTVPSRRECGLPDRGFVFCAFNASYKITPMMFDIWMRLLKQVEGSVLWLRQTNLVTSRNLSREAERRGVVAERLIFAPYAPDYAAHLARYRQADLFIDTLPYNAHTTASDALWAGVPVLTCLGETFAGRVAASVLKSIGLDDLVAHSLEEYESLALRLASEPSYLGALKERLANNRNTFPLFDAGRATRQIEAAYTLMWQRYRRGEAPKDASDGSDPIRSA
jgi:predicted O-linked N-acetylglucosamine transferase (SPINDLY family)